MKLKQGFKIALGTWKTTLGYFKANPNLLIPFFIVGIFDFLILGVIYLAPRPPLSALLAPPIRAFWGEKFLHYPFNLLLIPHLFNYGHIISTAFIGVLMTGLAIGMLSEAKEEGRPSVLVNLIRAAKRYPSLVAIWLVMFVLVTIVFKGLPFILRLKQPTALQIVFYVSFFISILIQVVFIYALPAVMIEKKRTWQAIKRSISFSKSLFLPTLLLVMIPMIIYLLLIILRGRLPILITKSFPEVILIFLGLGIVVSVIIDCLITYSTAILFLQQRRA